MGLLAVLLAGGATADWLAPSLRPTLSAAVGRDVDTLLDARSPGARMAGALLTKVKKALSSGTGEKPGLENPTLANRDSKSRSRMIPGRPVSGEAPAGLVNEQIQQLLGPLAGLESQVLSPGLETAGAATSGGVPLVLVGGGGGGLGGGAIGGSPISDVRPTSPAVSSPAVSNPVAPVPEPATWLTMVVGFGMAGAGLRRGKRLVKAAVRL